METSMSYTLITANRNYSSWSLRPWLLMKALGIPFEDRLEPFAKPDNYDDFRAFSPTGQVPLLLDGERRVWDSLGITLYLADRHPEVWPEDSRRARFRPGGGRRDARRLRRAAQRLHDERRRAGRAQADVAGARTQRRAGARDLRGRARPLRRAVAGRAQFTAADAFYARSPFRIRTYGLDVGDGAAWVERIIAHPAMQDWEAQALAETWREESHEAELAAAGTVTADYRQG
jgi:glutathione S-transferase